MAGTRPNDQAMRDKITQGWDDEDKVLLSKALDDAKLVLGRVTSSGFPFATQSLSKDQATLDADAALIQSRLFPAKYTQVNAQHLATGVSPADADPSKTKPTKLLHVPDNKKFKEPDAKTVDEFQANVIAINQYRRLKSVLTLPSDEKAREPIRTAFIENIKGMMKAHVTHSQVDTYFAALEDKDNKNPRKIRDGLYNLALVEDADEVIDANDPIGKAIKAKIPTFDLEGKDLVVNPSSVGVTVGGISATPDAKATTTPPTPIETKPAAGITMSTTRTDSVIKALKDELIKNFVKPATPTPGVTEIKPTPLADDAKTFGTEFQKGGPIYNGIEAFVTNVKPAFVGADSKDNINDAKHDAAVIQQTTAMFLPLFQAAATSATFDAYVEAPKLLAGLRDDQIDKSKLSAPLAPLIMVIGTFSKTITPVAATPPSPKSTVATGGPASVATTGAAPSPAAATKATVDAILNEADKQIKALNYGIDDPALYADFNLLEYQTKAYAIWTKLRPEWEKKLAPLLPTLSADDIKKAHIPIVTGFNNLLNPVLKDKSEIGKRVTDAALIDEIHQITAETAAKKQKKEAIIKMLADVYAQIKASTAIYSMDAKTVDTEFKTGDHQRNVDESWNKLKPLLQTHYEKDPTADAKTIGAEAAVIATRFTDALGTPNKTAAELKAFGAIADIGTIAAELAALNKSISDSKAKRIADDAKAAKDLAIKTTLDSVTGFNCADAKDNAKYTPKFIADVNTGAATFYNTNVKPLLTAKLAATPGVFDPATFDVPAYKKIVEDLMRDTMTAVPADADIRTRLQLPPAADIAAIKTELTNLHNGAIANARGVRKTALDALTAQTDALVNTTITALALPESKPFVEALAKNINDTVKAKFSDLNTTPPDAKTFEKAIRSLFSLAILDLTTAPDINNAKAHYTTFGLASPGDAATINSMGSAIISIHRTVELAPVAAEIKEPEVKAVWNKLQAEIIKTTHSPAELKKLSDPKEWAAKLTDLLKSQDPTKPTADELKAQFSPPLGADIFEEKGALKDIPGTLQAINKTANDAAIAVGLAKVKDFEVKLPAADEKNYSDEFKNAVISGLSARAGGFYNPTIRALLAVELGKKKFTETPAKIEEIKKAVEAFILSSVTKEPDYAAIKVAIPDLNSANDMALRPLLDKASLFNKEAVIDKTLTMAEAQIKASAEFKCDGVDFGAAYTKAQYHADVLTAWNEFRKELATSYISISPTRDPATEAARIANQFKSLLTQKDQRTNLTPVQATFLTDVVAGGSANGVLTNPTIVNRLVVTLEEANKKAANNISVTARQKEIKIDKMLTLLQGKLAGEFKAELETKSGNSASFNTDLNNATAALLPALKTKYSALTEMKDARAESEATALVKELGKIARSNALITEALIKTNLGLPPGTDVKAATDILQQLRAAQMVSQLEYALTNQPSAPKPPITPENKAFEATLAGTPAQPKYDAAMTKAREDYVRAIQAAFAPPAATSGSASMKTFHNKLVDLAKNKTFDELKPFVPSIATAMTRNLIKPDEIKLGEPVHSAVADFKAADKETFTRAIADANLAYYKAQMNCMLPDRKTELEASAQVLSANTAIAAAESILPPESKDERPEYATARKALTEARTLLTQLEGELKNANGAKAAYDREIEKLEKDRKLTAPEHAAIQTKIADCQGKAKALSTWMDKTANNNMADLGKHLKSINAVLPSTTSKMVSEDRSKLDVATAHATKREAFRQRTSKLNKVEPEAYEVWFGKRAEITMRGRKPAKQGLFQLIEQEHLFDPDKASNEKRNNFKTDPRLDTPLKQQLYAQALEVFELLRQQKTLDRFLEAYKQHSYFMQNARGNPTAFAKLSGAITEVDQMHATIAKEIADDRLSYSKETLAWLGNLNNDFLKLKNEMQITLAKGEPSHTRVFQEDTAVLNEAEFKTWAAAGGRKIDLSTIASTGAMRGVRTETKLALDTVKNVQRELTDVVIRVYPGDKKKESSQNTAIMYEKEVKSTGSYEIVLCEQQMTVSDRYFLKRFLTEEIQKNNWTASHRDDKSTVADDAKLDAVLNSLPPTLSDKALTDLFANKIHVARPRSLHDDTPVMKAFRDYCYEQRHTTVYINSKNEILTRTISEPDPFTGGTKPMVHNVNPYDPSPALQPTAKERLMYKSVSVPCKEMLQDAEVFLGSSLRSGHFPIEISAKNKDLLFAVVCLTRLAPELFTGKFILPPRTEHPEPTKLQLNAIKALDAQRHGTLTFSVRMGEIAGKLTTDFRKDLEKAQLRDEKEIKAGIRPGRPVP